MSAPVQSVMPVATPENNSLIYVTDCENQSHHKHHNNNYGPSMCSMILITLLVVGFFMLILSMRDSCNMDYLSGFFTPPEDSILGGMGKKSTMELPPIDHQAVELSLKDSFDNDLPNQTNKIPMDGTSYADVAADMALEKSVKEQHKQYVNQREKYTGTASFNPERSDSQDIVTFVGLRRPSYLTKEGSGLEDSTARQVSSVVDPKSLSKPVNLSWNYGSFE